MTSKKDITAAKRLLERNGFEVKVKRPEPRIGDIFDIDGHAVLITFHQLDSAGDGDTFYWGGVKVHEAKYEESHWESMWIDSEKYHKDPNSYKHLGHIDLSKAMSK
jgi:hypothetical protein